jgi:hypothetical protein
MQFYPEPLVPLRVPTPEERLNSPLVDIYVPDGRERATKLMFGKRRSSSQELKRWIAGAALASFR